MELRDLTRHITAAPRFAASGRVISLHGPLVTARLPQAAYGDMCTIERRGRSDLVAQVVGFSEDLVKLAPFDPLEGISPGAAVRSAHCGPEIKAPAQLLGSIIDALGCPLGGDAAQGVVDIKVDRDPPPALSRTPVQQRLTTGIRSIDALCTLGYGQRVGLFAGAGLGKSTLLGMIARNADVDVNVIALVGERGREVGDFIEESLGNEGLKKSVVIVSTSNEPPIRRALAARTATAIAEHFRDKGKRVLLLVDSLTRVARAVRDVTLASGELPVRQGYTPSVYAFLPSLLERAGTASQGSITGIYTVLTNGEGELDPLGEEVKSLLDGHLVLNEEMVRLGIRPAMDPLASISRLRSKLQSAQAKQAVNQMIRLLGRLRKDRDILLLGGKPDAELQAAIDLEPRVKSFLNQEPFEKLSDKRSESILISLANEFEERSISGAALDEEEDEDR